jgi:flagellin-like protein
MSNENLNIGFFNIKYSSVRLKSFRDNRKAISPVISTIIIVAVAIAISIAVAFWLGGITSIFTRFEKLEIPTAYAESKTGGGWTIILTVKNTGTTDTTITDVLINGIPYSSVTGVESVTIDSTDLPYPLKTGDSATVKITLTSDGFSAGQAVTVTIHTSGGQDYPKTVTLP